MAEQFAFDQFGGQRGAIERDNWFAFASAGLVYRLREQFLACACFTADKHRRIGGCHLRNCFQCFDDFRAFADDIVKIMCTHLFSQHHSFCTQKFQLLLNFKAVFDAPQKEGVVIYALVCVFRNS